MFSLFQGDGHWIWIIMKNDFYDITPNLDVYYNIDRSPVKGYKLYIIFLTLSMPVQGKAR